MLGLFLARRGKRPGLGLDDIAGFELVVRHPDALPVHPDQTLVHQVFCGSFGKREFLRDEILERRARFRLGYAENRVPGRLFL